MVQEVWHLSGSKKMALPQRDNLIDAIKRADALLERIALWISKMMLQTIKRACKGMVAMRTLVLITLMVVTPATLLGTVATYTAKDHMLSISTPKDFKVAPQKLINSFDKGRRDHGGTPDNRFVLFVRNGSLDPTGVQGDTLSISVNEYSDTSLELEDFAGVKELLIENYRTTYSRMPNVTFDKNEQGSNWTMASFTMKLPIPVAGRTVTSSLYVLTGMILIDRHMYTYVCQLFDAADDVKSSVRKNLKDWLSRGLAAAVKKKQHDLKKKRLQETFDLMSVGALPKSLRRYLPTSVYESMMNEQWQTKRTLGEEKTSGIDVQFKHPICMTCTAGNQPHIVFRIQKGFDQKVFLTVNVGVFVYDEVIMRLIRETTSEEAEGADFLEAVKELFVERGELSGCGITKIEGQNALWITVAQNVERLGVKMKTITRMFLIPTTGSKCLMYSFAVGVLDGAEYPTGDFERFLPVGMRMINSLTFMDKTQIKPVEKINATMSGTGWFATTEHVVTCWHVVEGCSDFGFVWPDGRRGKLILVGKDEFSDIAILKVADEGVSCPRPLRISTDKPEVSQRVFTVGYPLSDYMGKTPKYTEGVVSALSGSGDDESMLQTTTPIQSGNSGGPLLNAKCEVVGIMQSKFEMQGELKAEVGTVQNVNYAVKVYLVKRLARKLGIALATDAVGVAGENVYERVCAATVFIFAK